MVIWMKGPVARAGLILSFSKVRGTSVPKTVAKITTANSDVDTAQTRAYCPGDVMAMYRNTTPEMTRALKSDIRSPRHI